MFCLGMQVFFPKYLQFTPTFQSPFVILKLTLEVSESGHVFLPLCWPSDLSRVYPAFHLIEIEIEIEMAGGIGSELKP